MPLQSSLGVDPCPMRFSGQQYPFFFFFFLNYVFITNDVTPLSYVSVMFLVLIMYCSHQVKKTAIRESRGFRIPSIRQELAINKCLPCEKHMAGLALMVISPKNWEFLPLVMYTLLTIQPHLKSFNDFI